MILDEVKDRIDKINSSNPVDGDAVRISGGEVPVRPEPGRLNAVLWGAGGGAALGVLCVLMLALFDYGKSPSARQLESK